MPCACGQYSPMSRDRWFSIMSGHNFLTTCFTFAHDVTLNSGKTVSLLKKQLITQSGRLKKMEERLVQLQESHKKISERLQARYAGSARKDKYIEELEAKLKAVDDKDLMLSQSITKVAKAIFGK